MKKSSNHIIESLEQQYALIEARITAAKQLRFQTLDEQVARQRQGIKQVHSRQQTAHHSELALNKAKEALKALKTQRAEAKAEWQQALFEQQARALAHKRLAKSSRKKQVLGPKNKDITVPTNTPVPPLFLGIDPLAAVKPDSSTPKKHPF